MTHPMKLDLSVGEDAEPQTSPPADARVRLRALFERAAFGLLLVDREGRLVGLNPALCRLLGRVADDLLGAPVAALAPSGSDGAESDFPGQVEALLEGRADALAGEWPLGAEGRWVHVTLTPLGPSEGAPTLFFGQVFDATDERGRRERLRQAAHVDALTGIANRSTVLDRLRSALAHSRRAGDGVALVFGDLDNFKLINDSLGHEAGDRVLRLVADRLRESLRANDLVGRVGGDEFVAVLRGIARPEDPERVARSLLEVVQRDVRIDGHRVVPGISLGLAVAGPETTPEDLLRRADMAMYRAKADGGGRVFLYDDAMQAESKARFRLEEAIREGLDAGEFTTHFQPILSLEGQALFGVEALSRWRRHDGSEVAARAFLDVALESRTIDRIGAVVVEDVIRFLDRVRCVRGLVTMNLTAEEIRSGSTLDRIEAAIAEGRLDPHRLALELTETTTACLNDGCRQRLFDVIDRGVSLFLDDFGTGYSSIASLRDLPIRGIKLAPTFVSRIDQEPDFALAEALARFAERLALDRIAEGVETEAQEEALRRMRWPLVQGFRYGPARPLSTWLR